MKNRIVSLAFALCLIAGVASSPVRAQTNLLTQTTISTAALSTDGTIYVTSATGIQAPNIQAPVPSASELYVISPGNPRGEVMMVQAIGTAVAAGVPINVARGRSGIRSPIPAGALVLIGLPNWFRAFDPSGGCTLASTYIAPWVNTMTGTQWQCSPITLTWVPSWNSPYGDDFSVTAAVASAAGTITPSGPLFHVTGTAAITGFVTPIGFTSGSFSIIPDGVFTTTTAGNIAIASTAVVNKLLTFTWDATNSKFVPSY